MSDIVARLRAQFIPVNSGKVALAAADEIEQLRAENDVLHKTDRWRYENVLRMKAEIERLTVQIRELKGVVGPEGENAMLRDEIERLKARIASIESAIRDRGLLIFAHDDGTFSIKR